MAKQAQYIVTAEIVARYHSANLKEKNIIMTEILEAVRPMLFSRHYSFSNPEDRLDVMQEFRIGVMDALRDYDETLGCSFFTYLQYKLRGAFTRWRYYQSELVRTKDNRYKTKISVFSIDAPIQVAQDESMTYADLLQYDDQKNIEESFTRNMPAISDVLIWSEKNLKPAYAEIFKHWVTHGGNMVKTAEHIGVSRQYVGMVLQKIFKKIGRAYARTV